VLVLFLFVKTRYEEHLLKSRYPDYPEYRARAWGLLPPLR
jgi:protein-S-isoprenylcysteine O-methyltransferase Ste14